MKKSYWLLIGFTAFILVLISFSHLYYGSVYVTKEDYEDNAKKGSASLQAPLYNFQKTVLESSFNHLVLLPDEQFKGKNDLWGTYGRGTTLQWIKDEDAGFKVSHYEINNFEPELRQDTLYIYVKSNYDLSSLYLYSPTLKSIRAEGMNINLRNTIADRMDFDLKHSSLDYDKSNEIGQMITKLDSSEFRGTSEKSLKKLDYNLKGRSDLSFAFKTVDSVSIAGEPTTTARFQYLKDFEAGGSIGQLDCNAFKGSLRMTGVRPANISGPTDRIWMDLPMEQLKGIHNEQ